VGLFSTFLRRKTGEDYLTVEWLQERPVVISALLSGYDTHSVALNCGRILRECVQFEKLAKMVLYNPLFYGFFRWVEQDSFDVAADALLTFKVRGNCKERVADGDQSALISRAQEVLSRHPTMSVEFVDNNYFSFFKEYTGLLCSDNFVTKRQSIKLLANILLTRAYFPVMMRCEAP
jgi:calcium binding protein 39